MSGIENHALNVLKGLRALVGEVAFNAAVEALRADKDVAPGPAVSAAAAAPEKKKRTRNITDEQRAVITRNMTALQAFTKMVREELGESVAYAEAKATAGSRWKALSKEEKEAWATEHLDAEGSSTGAVVGAPKPASEDKVIAVAAADAEPKKGRGRPKKDAGATEVKVSKE
jgi:hypothetical protein